MTVVFHAPHLMVLLILLAQNQRRSDKVDLWEIDYLGSSLIDFVSQQASVLDSH